jgi:hypothetical protein
MKALVGQGQPASDLPSDVLSKLRGRLRSDNPSNACNTMTVAT